MPIVAGESLSLKGFGLTGMHDGIDNCRVLIPKGSSSRVRLIVPVQWSSSRAGYRSGHCNGFHAENETFVVTAGRACLFVAAKRPTRMEPDMELSASDFLSDLLVVILLDLVLAGDNAIVIALAARNLPKPLQKKAVLWGTFGAIVVRFAFTAVVVYLLQLPGLMLAGGLLLLPIAWKLLQSDDGNAPALSATGSFWAALRTIIVADALMGMDNVLAIAGASNGHLGLVILGLAISVPLVVWGSTLVLKLIERLPILIYVGAGAIAWTAGRMIAHDHLLVAWFEARDWASYGLDVLLITAICGAGWLLQRRRNATGNA
jgi:YjbE family integral membrane protein